MVKFEERHPAKLQFCFRKIIKLGFYKIFKQIIFLITIIKQITLIVSYLNCLGKATVDNEEAYIRVWPESSVVSSCSTWCQRPVMYELAKPLIPTECSFCNSFSQFTVSKALLRPKRSEATGWLSRSFIILSVRANITSVVFFFFMNPNWFSNRMLFLYRYSANLLKLPSQQF